ncbi:MAG: DUF3788 domain-containing protein [Firmicutes bacterium]|nr:DUF3788 domain-containing protein [Bacillota bacterium]
MKQDKLQLKEYNVFPTREVLQSILGDSYPAYEAFQESLVDFKIEQDWQWYKPYKAWFARGQYRWISPRGVSKEKTIYWVHFFDGYFVIAVWFKDKNRMEILNTNVSEDTKKLIRETGTMGKLPTFPVQFEVRNSKPLTDIYTLIRWKKDLEIV